MSTKINFIKQLKKRIIAISNEEYLAKNIKKLENILLKNSYPKSLIRHLLHSSANEQMVLRQINVNTETSQLAVLFDVPDLTNKIIKVFKPDMVKIFKKNIKTVGMIYSKLKDKTPPLSQSNVIYRLQCIDCEEFYVGQTSQTLKSRIAGHKSDSRLHPERCMLAAHVNNNDHKMNYEDVEILDVESNYTKRIFLEMYHINATEIVMNKRSDVKNLSSMYTYILNLGKLRREQNGQP